MLGSKLGIVLRARNGGNFLIQTHGLYGKTVQDATTDALETLGRHSDGGSGAEDPSGDVAPNFALGQLPVLQGRFLVTYRLVSSVLVLLVSEPHANAFLRLRTVDAITKVLVGACKGVSVSLTSLSKRLPEVHSLLGDLLAGGISALPPAFVHTSATDEKLLSAPLSASDAARKLRKLVAGGGKSSAFVPGRQEQQQPDGAAVPGPEGDLHAPYPETPTASEAEQQRLAAVAMESADPLQSVDFVIPADALPQPPARAFGARRRPPAPPRPSVQSRPPSAFEGAVEEEAKSKASEEAEQEAEQAPEAQQQGATDGEWAADFESSGISEAKEAATGPALTVDDLKEALQLVEVYRGVVVGGVLRKSGVEGSVRRRLAPYGLTAARFRLLPSPAALVVNACLQTASRSKALAAIEAASDDEHTFAAMLSGAPMDTSYLKYMLPSTACDPPLQLDLLTAPQAADSRPAQGQGSWQSLVVLRWVANPKLSGPLLDVVVDLDVPPELNELVKASPPAQWSRKDGRLRWNLGKLEPGVSGIARVVLAVKGTGSETVQRAQTAVKEGEITANVVFTGWPGRAFSGLGFQVAMPFGVEHHPNADEGKAEHSKLEFYPGKVVTFGEMHVRC